jgi:nucleoside-diphosphate-sugar epimerase
MLQERKPPIFNMNSSKKYFITGASGFIGSHLATALAQEGHSVYLLVRPSKEHTVHQRWDLIADWLELAPETRGRITVFSGDLDSSDLNLSPDNARFLKENVEEIVHAAANTSFSAKKRDEAIRTNITGLQNLISFSESGSFRHIHYISTAYVANRALALSPEALSNSTEFCNPYEETKHQAESLIHDYCRRTNVRLSIYRPSIVYGNSKTGRTFRFNALYHPIRSIAYLVDLFKSDILENSGLQAKELGISLNPANQRLHLPICFQTGKSGGLNLVPIDCCTDSIMGIMKTKRSEGFFHIVNKHNTSMEDLVSYAREFFNVSGLHVKSSSRVREQDPRPLDHLFQRYMEPFQPYIEDTRVFDTSRAAHILKPLGIECPVFSHSIFARCMTYALDNNWGRNLDL